MGLWFARTLNLCGCSEPGTEALATPSPRYYDRGFDRFSERLIVGAPKDLRKVRQGSAARS